MYVSETELKDFGAPRNGSQVLLHFEIWNRVLDRPIKNRFSSNPDIRVGNHNYHYLKVGTKWEACYFQEGKNGEESVWKPYCGEGQSSTESISREAVLDWMPVPNPETSMQYVEDALKGNDSYRSFLRKNPKYSKTFKSALRGNSTVRVLNSKLDGIFPKLYDSKDLGASDINLSLLVQTLQEEHVPTLNSDSGSWLDVKAPHSGTFDIDLSYPPASFSPALALPALEEIKDWSQNAPYDRELGWNIGFDFSEMLFNHPIHDLIKAKVNREHYLIPASSVKWQISDVTEDQVQELLEILIMELAIAVTSDWPDAPAEFLRATIADLIMNIHSRSVVKI